MDRERVINGLAELKETIRTAKPNSFVSGGFCAMNMKRLDNAIELLKDEKEYCNKCAESAIKTTVELQEEIARLRSLLKEQEAEWLEVDEKHDAFDCSNCGAMAGRKCLYCPGCGAKMKNGTRAMEGR